MHWRSYYNITKEGLEPDTQVEAPEQTGQPWEMILMSRRHGFDRAVVVAGGLVLSLSVTLARAQDPLENATLIPQPAAKGDESATRASASTSPADGKAKAKAKPEFINKTPAEWRRLLSRLQFTVTREKGTEPPFTGKYASGHFKGTFVCVCCEAAHVQSELFSSATKFDSGTGWPSFYQPVSPRAVHTAWDYSGLEPRLEVDCRRCGAHLGHVFDDGPPPTGLRFCINSAAIMLETPDVESGTKNTAGKAASKSKAKAKSKTGTKAAPPATQPEDSTDREAPTDKAKGASSSPSP
jgi:peptide-methionine (R)-S-oxide reductase